MKRMAIRAKKASYALAMASSDQKNAVLKAMTEYLDHQKDLILEANRQDISLAKINGLNNAMIDRLSLENRLEGIIQDLHQIILLPDPIGEVIEERTLPNQLILTKRRTPIGVLGVIYESRPNVTLDISALAIKSGNCAILRGGSETLHTNGVLIKIIQRSLSLAGLPFDAIQLVLTPDRTKVKQMLQLDEYIDLIIPRGSAGLQQFCRQNSTIPVITGGIGICHLFVDESAHPERSIQVIMNAKTQRPTVCNALDTLLVHEKIATYFIPKLIEALSEKGVTFRLDPKAWKLGPYRSCTLAKSEDWDTEWLSLVLGIRIVENLQEAVKHIQSHSSRHSDGILTENQQNAEQFIREVDSAAVYVNASTRFTDGGQFGLGAELAVSTQKLHARGPMGIKEITTYKWVAMGDYHMRAGLIE